ncbi:MAG: histidinol phosphatase [Clostridiales bacterium]|nr:histidinol phosphatase [Clostridiales bacterium]
MRYKYETHSHTSETSKCSKIPGAELARFYKSLGYTGLFITDHFFNGNTIVPRDLEWKERVERFEAGYLAAKAEGDKIGLDVFFGWEYTIGGNDFLIYGLDREWLLANPDQLEWKLRDYMSKARADGALVIHAHPFREAGYIELIRLIPRDVDGVEVINSSMTDEVNARADWYADSYRLLRSAGSDNHVGKRSRLGGVYLPERIKCEADFVQLMKAGQCEIFMDEYDENGMPINKEGNR